MLDLPRTAGPWGYAGAQGEAAMRYQGRIIEWNDARGFGFVRRHGDADGKVFLHIGAFRARDGRPRIGDVVTYTVERDERGRPRACDVEMMVDPRRRAGARPAAKAPVVPLSRVLGVLAACAVAVVLATLDWGSLLARFSPRLAPPPQTAVPAAQPISISRSAPAFRCTGKRHCSQMTSCAEAKFYLRHCPGTLADGDHDGIPCEDQWCGH